jgi:hypothetical protein
VRTGRRSRAIRPVTDLCQECGLRTDDLSRWQSREAAALPRLRQGSPGRALGRRFAPMPRLSRSRRAARREIRRGVAERRGPLLELRRCISLKTRNVAAQTLRRLAQTYRLSGVRTASLPDPRRAARRVRSPSDGRADPVLVLHEIPSRLRSQAATTQEYGSRHANVSSAPRVRLRRRYLPAVTELRREPQASRPGRLTGTQASSLPRVFYTSSGCRFGTAVPGRGCRLGLFIGGAAGSRPRALN